MTNGRFHRYHLDEPNFILGKSRVISLFDENHVSKQNSPRWDAAFCGVTYEAILVEYVP